MKLYYVRCLYLYTERAMVNLIPLKSLCKTTRGIYGFMNDYGTTRHVVYTVLWTTVVQNDTWYIRCYERLWYI